jgi:hypothetical protein
MAVHQVLQGNRPQLTYSRGLLATQEADLPFQEALRRTGETGLGPLAASMRGAYPDGWRNLAHGRLL